MITYHLSGNKVYRAGSAEEAAVFTELMMKVNITALQSNQIERECFASLAKLRCKTSLLVLDQRSVIFFLIYPTPNDISGSFKFSEIDCVLLPCLLTASNVG